MSADAIVYLTDKLVEELEKISNSLYRLQDNTDILEDIAASLRILSGREELLKSADKQVRK